MSALVVNFYGGHGEGRADAASSLCSTLKMYGINAEFVTSDREVLSLATDSYVFGEQYSKIKDALDNADVVITDEPVLLSVIYSRTRIEDAFVTLALRVNENYNSLNYYLLCDDVEMSEKDDVVKFLEEHNIKYTAIPESEFDCSAIVDDVANAAGKQTHKKCNMCGRDLDFWDLQEDFSIKRECGYGTIFDGDSLFLRMCCSCMEKLVESCVVSPVEENTYDVISTEEENNEC